jgi:hypothetical protein
LSVLVEELRAPGAARAEVDALLAGLSQPLPPDASLREHADLLLALMEDAQLADYTGSDGRTVRTAAIQALLALGYPYALEVPPEALAAKARDEGGPPGLLSTRKGQVGFGLVVLSGILEWVAVLSITGMEFWTQRDELVTNALVRWGTAITSASIFLPALLTLLGHNRDSRGLKGLGTGWLTLMAIFWLMVGIFTLPVYPYNVIPLLLGGMTLVGTLLMTSKD